MTMPEIAGAFFCGALVGTVIVCTGLYIYLVRKWPRG